MSMSEDQTAPAPIKGRAPTTLRRLVSHLRRHDWTTAGIEFLIVILGVFVGLQANTWSAQQTDKRRGEEYVERLIVDLERDLVQRRNLVAYYEAVQESAERTHTLLLRSDSDARALVINAYRATEFSGAPWSRATWEEIVSSGDLALLPRSAIDGGLLYYFDDNTAVRVFEALRASRYRRRVRGALPHGVQTAIRQGCGDLRDASEQITGFREDCVLGSAESEIGMAAQALRDDPEMLTDLRYHFSDLDSAQRNLRADLIFLERALAALKADDRGR